MKVKSCKITENGEKLTVTVEVVETMDRNPAKDRKFYSTEDIKTLLKKEGYKNVGPVVEGAKISNFQGKKAAKGTWVFLTDRPRPTVKQVRSKPKPVTTPEPTPEPTLSNPKPATKKRTSRKRVAKTKLAK